MLKHFRVPGRLPVKLAEFGIAIPAVLRRAGLPQDLFEQKRVLVSTEELFALWDAIGSVSADPFIGLKIGIETKTERFHPMGIVALSTENTQSEKCSDCWTQAEYQYSVPIPFG